MTDPLSPPSPQATPSESKGKSCWLIGCSGCLILILLVFLGSIGAWFWFKSQFMVEPFEPMELSETEESAIQAKLRSYNMVDESGEFVENFEFPAGVIEFTEDELNYLISRDEETGDMFRIDLEPNEIYAEIRVGEPGKDERWGFGGRISVEQTEQGLDVRIIDLKLGSFDLPQEFLDELGAENLTDDVFSESPETQEAMEKIQSIEVLKDKIIITPKTP